MDLFEENHVSDIPRSQTPLADRMRPRTLDEFFGQQHIIGQNRALRRMLETRKLCSMLFWGPPGVGKTTLARIIAHKTHAQFYTLSAVSSGVAEVRKIIAAAKEKRGRSTTILFIDEIHRFNKAQQDALLHAVEDGTLLLIGATTENPSFEVIAPLLSRCRIFKLEPLNSDDIGKVIARALREDELLQSKNIIFDEGVKELLVTLAAGDARAALNSLELASNIASRSEEGTTILSRKLLEEAVQKRTLLYDKKGDFHYDTISAFIKSVRGSDPDAGLYWLARMLHSGEDPKFIARRLIIVASEDVGNADPHALMVATSAFKAVEVIGMPEARIVLAQATAYLASAPKSNASYLAIDRALRDIEETESFTVPLHLRNAPTSLMKEFGYAAGYKYPHDSGGFVEQDYRPKEAGDKVYYRPTESGIEKKIKDRLKKLWPKRHYDN